MSVDKPPCVSVVIATYNWSSVLELALESVRDQTFKDYEVLIVGDACTDDSEEVVRAFRDPRFSWSNLPENCGSQWGPNNHGLSLAAGEFIAYLGHDDLWWPTHLETALAVFERTGADVVAAAAILYGPPESGVRSVTGFFPNDTYDPRYFFPPSSMLHRRELAQRIGGWRSPEQANFTTDYDFLVRCRDAGARFAATGEFTAFKFNAAWRRNSYRRKDVSEQGDYLARMRREGEAFRLKELRDTLRAAAEDRLHRIEFPPSGNFDATRNAAASYAFKSAPRAVKTASVTLATGRMRFLPENEYSGFEWHQLETHPLLGAFRWSGPSRRSTIVLPVRIDRPLDLTALVVSGITDDTLQSARLSVNDVAVETAIIPGPHGAHLWSGRIDPARLPVDDRDETRLTIEVEKTFRPLDRGINEDRRWLGLAVGWIEIG